jgi:CheY-like chemotaxis protein
VTIRVFLVDDQALVRTGIAMVVEAQDDMHVVGEAGDGAQALERLAATRADVVLMDVRMPRLDGVPTGGRVARTPTCQRRAGPAIGIRRECPGSTDASAGRLGVYAVGSSRRPSGYLRCGICRPPRGR